MVLTTINTIVNYDRKTFIAQPTGVIFTTLHFVYKLQNIDRTNPDPAFSYRQTAPSIAYLLQDWCYIGASIFHGMQRFLGANPKKQSLLETNRLAYCD
jgi:hypothetical protein